MTVTRSRAEDFLELLNRSRRGRLKVYIGSVAGVGKTYRMLQEAHALQSRGVDVVLAYIEAHQRAETQTLVAGLELIPRKIYEYRGVNVEEMDLDAVLARRPQIAVVDELAHTNVPLCRNRRRFQDVLEILDAGINVICAFNVQHLESLNDLVERATGVAIRETIPDSFIQQADQVVNLDLSVEDLIDRLNQGKIYPQEKVTWALEHFFRAENLATLRELALREVAESIDRAATGNSALPGGVGAGQSPAPTPPGSGRVMVCLPPDAERGKALLRRGSRLAGRLNTSWFVVFVETPNLSPERIDSETQRHLYDNIQLATELGAEVVKLKSKEPVGALLDFARIHRIRHMLVGRSHAAWWKHVLGLSVMDRMVRDAAEFDLYIVGIDEPKRAQGRE